MRRAIATPWLIGILFLLIALILSASFWFFLKQRHPTSGPSVTSTGENTPPSVATTMLPKASVPSEPTQLVKEPGPSSIVDTSNQRIPVEWAYEDIDLSPKVGVFASLVRMPSGELYAAYLDDQNDDLKLATRSEASWQAKSITPDPKGHDGWYPSLALDREGNLHVSYFSISKRQVIYGTMAPNGGWQFETAVNQVSVLDTALAVGDGAVPYIVYLEEETLAVKMTSRQAGHWVTSVVGQGNQNGGKLAIAVDRNNQIRVVYQASAGELVCASLIETTWHTQRITAEQEQGDAPSVALDSLGYPHVSFFDPIHLNLHYAYWDGAQWLSETVDASGTVGKFSSIAVDSQGTVHISYYDETNKALKYALRRAGKWNSVFVDHSGNVGQYNALVLDQDLNPEIGYYDASNRVLRYAAADVNHMHPQPQKRITALHRSGQTFLTWTERSDLVHERYRIYRSDQPLTASNVQHAALLAEVGEESGKLWANYRMEGSVGEPRLTDRIIIENGAAPLKRGLGAFVWTVSPEDFQGRDHGSGYYAVTVLAEGGTTEAFSDQWVVGPVQEAVADPMPVEITASPLLRIHAEAGGHYYLQYMDFRRWNPTFHAPNATNQYYGFDPNDPTFKTALAYAYDYAIFEPTPELCGGKVPEALPVLVFLHGARGNRYGTPDKYPYPYCAYGVYPIDQTETWYFGFAQKHDYRNNAAFSPDDRIENYTEQRILRMLYDLIRRPPGPTVDVQRIYLFGHSMGGTGALAFAERYPNVFAAIYSGQPVTHFFATEGFQESWPTNLATKWGPQAMNLPIVIAAPNHWADPLQNFNGVGIYDWENLRAAFSQEDKLQRSQRAMAPFGVDHGTIDDAVLFPTQGQPLYPLLNASLQTWAGAVTETSHQWSSFGWPLPNLAKRQGVPFWGFGVIRDETIPGFRVVDPSSTEAPNHPITYHQTLLWSSSWNAWDGVPVDQANEWQISFCTVVEGSQSCGGDRSMRIDLTPRRLQKFVIVPGKTYSWENRQRGSDEIIEKGTVTADGNGLLILANVRITPEGNRIHLFAP